MTGETSPVIAPAGAVGRGGLDAPKGRRAQLEARIVINSPGRIRRPVIDDFTIEHLDQHWVPLGEFVASEVTGTHVELQPLLYNYWTSIFPDADSVDDPVDLTHEGLSDRYSDWVSLSWAPLQMGGGTRSSLGALTIGDHTFIAEPPDIDSQMGWLLHGEADSDREGTIGNFLIDQFGALTQIPDRITTDVPPETIREWLKSTFDAHDPSDFFGWDALAAKVGASPEDREAALDRYVADRVWQ